MVRHTGVLQLPGTLAATELLSAEDGYGGRYGLVRDRHTGYLTATLRVVPVLDLAGRHRRRRPVGRELGRAGWRPSATCPTVRWVTVTVDTAPDPGSTLTGQVAAAIDPAAPRAGARDHGPARRRRARRRGRRRHPGQHHLRPGRLPRRAARPWPRRSPRPGRPWPAWNRRSAPAGSPCWAAPAPPTSPGSSAPRSTRRCAAQISRLLATGISPALEEQLNWASAGPAGAEERWDRYRHDSGTSVSWAWREAPRQNVRADVLARLLGPGPLAQAGHPAVPAAARRGRGRDPGQRGPGRRVPPRVLPPHPPRRQPPATPTTTPAPGRPPTRKPAAPGSACSACTSRSPSPTPRDLSRATADTEAAAESSKIRLQRLYRSQAAGFTATLPCGICLPELAARLRH